MRQSPVLPRAPLSQGPARAHGARRGLLALALCALLAWPAAAAAEPRETGEAPTSRVGPTAWSEEILDTWRRTPVQDGGRVKPFQSFARFALLGINGRTSLKLEEGEEGERRLGAVAWALDTMLFPETASDYPVFLVEDSALLEAIGLEDVARRKRDRYSFSEIAPGLQRLAAMTAEVRRMARRDSKWMPDPLQRHALELSESVNVYLGLLRTFDWMRAAPAAAAGTRLLPDEIGDGTRPMLAAWPEQAPRVFRAGFGDLATAMGRLEPSDARPEGLAPDQLAVYAYVIALPREVGTDLGPALLPPPPGLPRWTRPNEYAWYPALEWMGRQPEGTAERLARPNLILPVEHEPLREDALEHGLPLLARVFESRRDPSAFLEASRAWKEHARERAAARGEYEHGDLEVFLYGLNPFFWALLLFVFAFVLVAFSWLKPGAKWLERSAWPPVFAALGLLVFGIVLRCIIRGRPPVSTLYETVLFITACGGISLVVIEAINRQRIALPLATLLGAGGLWLASAYETLEGRDTMPQLQAVLDTDFWLGTHVTCITLGYAAGLLAALIGHVYVLGKALGLKSGDSAFYGTLYRMVYGTVAFCLLFSLVGTILGGIWANDSWGRFWGWDPKENGALMICLWATTILHARMGGYLRGFGTSMAAVFLGCVVAWSWWGVNQLQVGLHSYGFTAGVVGALKVAAAFEGAVLLTGLVTWLTVIRTPRG